VVSVSLAAAASDLRSRRIPNALVAAAAAVGCALAALGGPRALLESLLGGLVAGLPLLGCWARGLVGAGDAKLAFALGVLLGMPWAPVALLWGTVLGGVVAAALVAVRLATLGPRCWCAARRRGARAAWGLLVADPVWHASLPYGAFLAAGAVAALAVSAGIGRGGP